MVCESGTQKSGSVKKHYLINAKEEIEEIPLQKALGLLESYDEVVYTIPKNYDKLIAVGWKKFVEDTDQIIARSFSVKLSTSQNWIIKKLLEN